MREHDRVIILDTSALLALLDFDDKFHEQASDAYDRLLRAHASLWITSYLRVETSALVHARLGFEPLRRLMASLDAVVTTLWLEQSLHTAAWREFVARQGQRLSFVDCTTLLVARGLDAAVFSFDTDFTLEGLSVVP